MMKTIGVVAVVLASMIGVWTIGSVVGRAQVESNDKNVAVLDDCDPTDPTWAAVGGCNILPTRGDVTRSEFATLLVSPLSLAVVGHPSWRNEPSYLTVKAGDKIRVMNKGGRGHTFTEVANFGGGFAPPLNIGLTPAPECTPAGTVPLPPGAVKELTGLAPGMHRFQCCIHPWMRATIRVQ